MSFVKDLLFGQKGEAARVEDLRSPTDTALRGQAGGMIGDLLSGVRKFPDPSTAPPGPVAPMTAGETETLRRINELIPGFAPLISTSGEKLRQFASGAGATGNTAMSPFGTIAASPFGATATDAFGLTATDPFSNLVKNPALAAPGMDLAARILQGKTATPESDALLQSAIATAQRPLTERFDEDLGAMRSAMTRAGQFVQPGASSPFELAQAKLKSGLASAMGDVASNISFANLKNERDRQDMLLALQANALEAGLGRRQGSEEGGLNRRLSAEEGGLNRRLSAEEGGLARRQTAEEGGLNRQLAATTAAPSFSRGVLESLTEAMRANALPRLIEQGGIEAGTQNFNTQSNQFLQLLLNAFGGTAPQPVSIPGTEGTGGLVGSLLPAVATGFGGPIGAALAKIVI